MLVDVDIICPYCDFAGVSVDTDSGDLIVDGPCEHLLFICGYVTDSEGWRQRIDDELESLRKEIEGVKRLRKLQKHCPERSPKGQALADFDEDSMNDFFFNCAMGGSANETFRPSVEASAEEEFSVEDDWHLNALFSVDATAFVRETAEHFRE